MTSKQDDRIDGRPFYLEEVTIEEPSTDIKYDKVIVEPINNQISKLHEFWKIKNIAITRNIKKPGSIYIIVQQLQLSSTSGLRLIIGLGLCPPSKFSGISSRIFPANKSNASPTF